MSAASPRETAAAIVRELRARGHEAWFVGGCVRETLLGREPADWDVTTDASPDRVAEIFPHVVEVGKRFGVTMVVRDGVVTEVATFRTEGSYTDGRRPDSVTFASAAEDVARRDFTINALLMDPVTGDVVDHVGGRADLESGVVRTVGDPERRFAEDRLRLLRAARFTARLGFRLDPAAREACRRLAPTVASVSAERVLQELGRMLAHASRAEALRLLGDLGLLEHVLPEVHALNSWPRDGVPGAPLTAFQHAEESLRRLRAEASEPAAWAVLLHQCGVPLAGGAAHEAHGARVAAAVAARLKMSRRDAERVASLVRDHRLVREAPGWPLSRLRELLASPLLADLVDVARAEGDEVPEVTAGLAHLEEARVRWGTGLPAPLVDGSDVLRLGVPAGPRVKELLRAVREEQLEGLLATREEALRRAGELAAAGPGPG